MDCVPHLHDRPNFETVKKLQSRRCAGRRFGLRSPDGVPLPVQEGRPRRTRDALGQRADQEGGVLRGLRGRWAAARVTACVCAWRGAHSVRPCVSFTQTLMVVAMPQTPGTPLAAPAHSLLTWTFQMGEQRCGSELRPRHPAGSGVQGPVSPSCGALVCCEGLRETLAPTLPTCPPPPPAPGARSLPRSLPAPCDFLTWAV